MHPCSNKCTKKSHKGSAQAGAVSTQGVHAPEGTPQDLTPGAHTDSIPNHAPVLHHWLNLHTASNEGMNIDCTSWCCVWACVCCLEAGCSCV